MGALLTSGTAALSYAPHSQPAPIKNFMLHHAVTSVLPGDSSALMGLDQAPSEVQRQEGSDA